METDAEHSAGEQIHNTAELLFSFSTPLYFFFFFFLNHLTLPDGVSS